MKFEECSIEGLRVIRPRRFKDGRGYFSEVYREDLFVANGIVKSFVQGNISVSKKGTLRGLHFQKNPKQQAKLIQVVEGCIFDVAVDMRTDSKTCGDWFGVQLSDVGGEMLYVPEGFAHGFLALSDTVKMLYKVSDYYSPEHEGGIHWNDPGLAIEWPNIGLDYTLSDKDQMYPTFESVVKLGGSGQ